MDKFSLARALAILAASSALTACDAPPVPTVLPPVPGPTAQSNPDALKGTVCVGVGKGYGPDMVERDLYRAASLDPTKNPISPAQPMTVYVNPDAQGIGYDRYHSTYGDLSNVSLIGPGNDGMPNSAVCLTKGEPKDPLEVFNDLAKRAGIPLVPEVCALIQNGDTPVVAMNRALQKAGGSEKYNAFITRDNQGTLRPPMLNGDVRAGAYRQTIYSGTKACVGNWFSIQRTTRK